MGLKKREKSTNLKGFILTDLNWEYNDNWYDQSGETPIEVYFSRDLALKACATRNLEEFAEWVGSVENRDKQLGDGAEYCGEGGVDLEKIRSKITKLNLKWDYDDESWYDFLPAVNKFAQYYNKNSKEWRTATNSSHAWQNIVEYFFTNFMGAPEMFCTVKEIPMNCEELSNPNFQPETVQ